MLIGAGALMAGVGIVLLAVSTGSAAAFFGGTVVAGVGFGGGFQGAIRSVVPLARPHERAGVLSVVYVVSYLAMGVPAVMAGFLAVHDHSVLTTARQYGAAVLVLAALALIGSARRRGEGALAPVAAGPAAAAPVTAAQEALAQRPACPLQVRPADVR
jgi:hypothetical protein